MKSLFQFAGAMIVTVVVLSAGIVTPTQGAPILKIPEGRDLPEARPQLETSSLPAPVQCNWGNDSSAVSAGFPKADAWGAEGDDLYAIYRKGLITRHITRNGRVLETVALKNIHDVNNQRVASIVEEQDPTRWALESSGKAPQLLVRYPDKEMRPINRYEMRYAWSETAGAPGQQPLLWVPIRAPMKLPGIGNEVYEVVAGDGDNPFYYGGMALATFSLEHMYCVSPHSIGYARKMVEYLLASEMNGENGYLIRIRRPYDSNRNKGGEPVVQGASPEELMGTMLGLMYYLKAEDPNHELYSKAVAFRQRLLERIASDSPVKPDLAEHYAHPFMVSSNSPTYQVHVPFEWTFWASSGKAIEDKLIDQADKKDWYERTMRLFVTGGAQPSKFEDWSMFLTSAILVLDGDIPRSEKAGIAGLLMTHIIKQGNVDYNGRDKLKNNAYMSVVAQLVNKYMPDNKAMNSAFEGPALRDTWKGSWDEWKRVSNGVNTIFHSSCINKVGMPVHFQCNLPLVTKYAPPSTQIKPHLIFDPDEEPFDPEISLHPDPSGNPNLGDRYWLNHNPGKGIGHWFAWKYPAGSYVWTGKGRWFETLPGYQYNYSFAPPSSLDGYLNGDNKRYSQIQYLNYIATSPVGSSPSNLLTKGHQDIQIEGAGIGLTFLRMLLTHINPTLYPPPSLGNTKNIAYPLLDTNWIEPVGPQYLNYGTRYKGAKIGGDRERAVGVASVGTAIVVASANENEKLILRPFRVTEGGVFQEGKEVSGGRFDQVVLDTFEDKQRKQFLVVAERAEKDKPMQSDPHWLRLSLYSLDITGAIPTLTRVAQWQDDEHQFPNSVSELDMSVIDAPAETATKNIAVTFLDQHENARVKIFSIRLAGSTGTIAPVAAVNADDKNIKSRSRIAVETAYDNIVLQAGTHDTQSGLSFSIVSKIFNPTSHALSNGSKVTIKQATLLDIKTIKPIRPGDKWYLVSAYARNVPVSQPGKGELIVEAWEIQPSGQLISKGVFSAKPETLMGYEWGWTRGSLSRASFNGRQTFVLVGKAIARVAAKITDGKLDGMSQSALGMKVVYGEITADGRPTLRTSNVFGSGKDDAMTMLDVSGVVPMGRGLGVVTVHKTDQDRLNLVSWIYRNDFAMRPDFVGPLLPDIAIKEMSFSPSAAIAGSEVVINATLINAGKATSPPSTASIKLGNSAATDFAIPSLPVGATFPLVKRGLFQAPGTYAVTMTIDQANHMYESNESNNLRTQNIIVGATSQTITPSLQIPPISDTSKSKTPVIAPNKAKVILKDEESSNNDSRIVRPPINQNVR